MVFSISIQKNGPPLRTSDESSSADFHGGWTSDRNRCVGDINDAGLTLARDYEQSTKYLLTPYSGSVPSSGSP